MEHETTHAEHQPDQLNRLKKFGFGVLGAMLGIDGARGVVAGVIITPLNPVIGVLAAGIGAAESYGAYRLMKHANGLDRTHEQMETHESRLTRAARYLGGAALTVGGGLLAVGAVLSTPVAAVGFGLASIGISAYGAYKMFNSFENVPKEVATPSIGEQLTAVYHNIVGTPYAPVGAH